MDDATIARIESSYHLLAPHMEQLVGKFYAHLLSTYPEVRPLFSKDVGQQHRKFSRSLAMITRNLRQPEALRESLLELGRLHQAARVEERHYPPFRDMLVQTMAEVAGRQWNQQLTADWKGAIDFVISIMLVAHRDPRPAANQVQ